MAPASPPRCGESGDARRRHEAGALRRRPLIRRAAPDTSQRTIRSPDTPQGGEGGPAFRREGLISTACEAIFRRAAVRRPVSPHSPSEDGRPDERPIPGEGRDGPGDKPQRRGQSPSPSPLPSPRKRGEGAAYAWMQNAPASRRGFPSLCQAAAKPFQICGPPCQAFPRISLAVLGDIKGLQAEKGNFTVLQILAVLIPPDGEAGRAKSDLGRLARFLIVGNGKVRGSKWSSDFTAPRGERDSHIGYLRDQRRRRELLSRGLRLGVKQAVGVSDCNQPLIRDIHGNIQK